MTYQGPDPNQQPAPQPWPQQPQQPPYGTPQPQQPQQQGWAQPQQPQQPYQDPQQQSGAQQWPQQPQPPYGTPQPPQQPPYGTQQQTSYGTPQPPYDQQQAWPNQQPPFQPPKNNRTGLIVGIAVVVALAIGGGVYALTSSNKNSNNNTATGGSTASPSSAATKAATSGAGSATTSSAATSAAATSGSLTLPTSAGGLSLMSGSVADNVVAAMKKADSSSPIYQNALFGAYSQSGGTYFADLTLVPMSEAGAIATTYQSEGGAATLQSIAQAASLTDTATENSPVSGGSMVCGTLTTASLTLRSCIWIDNDEYGITAMPSSQSNDQAAAYAGALESTSEQ